MKKFSPTDVVDAALRDQRIAKSSMPLLNLICEMDENGLRRATQEELAYALDRSVPWIRMTAKHFAACGYIAIVRRARNREATYTIKMPLESDLAYRGCSVWTAAELTPNTDWPDRMAKAGVDDTLAKITAMIAELRKRIGTLDL